MTSWVAAAERACSAANGRSAAKAQSAKRLFVIRVTVRRRTDVYGLPRWIARLPRAPHERSREPRCEGPRRSFFWSAQQRATSRPVFFRDPSELHGLFPSGSIIKNYRRPSKTVLCGYRPFNEERNDERCNLCWI